MPDHPQPVPTELIVRLRQATDWPWSECKRVLAELAPDERERWYERLRESRDRILRDPIEDDPSVRPLFLAACDEARREVEEWHRQRMAELEVRSPAVADVCRSGRGLCHRVWGRIQEILRERHGIAWRSPREMNPWVTFD